MLNYKTMTAKEAIRTAKEESGLPPNKSLNVSMCQSPSSDVISKRMTTTFQGWRCYHAYVLP